MNITQALSEKFGDAVLDVETFLDETTYVIQPSKIVEVCRFLHDTTGLEFTFLSDITGVDYLGFPEKAEHGRLAACYHLLSMSRKERIRLKVHWDDGEEPIPSVCGVWKSANWEEREAFDMYGIEFSDHPDLRRLLMPPEWSGFPGRKDYPLGYETVQFSFNYDEVNQYKPYAKE